MNKKKLTYIFILLFTSITVGAMEIKGNIDLQDEWQPVVYLASLNAPENLFVASPDFVIAETFIQPDGSFNISTNSIPEDARFYRLYMVKGDGASVEFNTSDHRNYVHLLLDKNSSVEIKANLKENSFSVTEIKGSADNMKLLEFDRELAKREVQFTSDITKTKSDYLSADIENFIRKFVEEESNTLIGLYALYHLEEKDTDFLKNSEFYFTFQKRIKEQYSGTFYAQVYDELLQELVGFREMVCEMPGVQPKWKDNLLIAQSIIILLLVVVLIYFMVDSKRKLKRIKQKSDKSNGTFSKLTIKEQEILRLLANGKTNKEIAADLYVELSTVKTHINSIYKQLRLSNRKEAIEYFRTLNKG